MNMSAKLIVFLVYELGRVDEIGKLGHMLYILSHLGAIPQAATSEMSFDCQGCLGMTWQGIHEVVRSAQDSEGVGLSHAHNWTYRPGERGREIADEFASLLDRKETVRLAALLNGYEGDILETAAIKIHIRGLDATEGQEVLDELDATEEEIDRAERLIRILGLDKNWVTAP